MIHHQALKVMAATIWYGGSVALFLKSGELLAEAHPLRPQAFGHLLLSATGVLLGLLKGRWLFSAACVKNLRRIDQLRQPRWWQCYRPRFFVFLALMVSCGAVLSRLAAGNYWLLGGVAALDLSIAVALLSGGRAFWTRVSC